MLFLSILDNSPVWNQSVILLITDLKTQVSDDIIAIIGEIKFDEACIASLLRTMKWMNLQIESVRSSTDITPSKVSKIDDCLPT
mmetsp:Transcript_68980/g.77157  ORF Transcript_68980/g.77157 Transcript_68980/m.77157 type:complete len:84 (-) Transcript_68980:2442-2693(-)